MKLNFSPFIIILLLLSSSNSMLAQDKIEGIRIDKLQLPSIRVLMDSAAANSPLLKMGELQTRVMESDALSMKREWLRSIGVESSYHYGNLGSLSTIDNTSMSQINTSLAYAKQNTYSAGVYMRIPISEVADRKNKKRIGQLRIELAKQEEAKMKSELNEKIIIEYNRATLYLDLLKIKSGSIESANLQIILAEKQFRNGSLGLLELSALQDRQAKAASEYLLALSEAKSELMLLEQICGVKILN